LFQVETGKKNGISVSRPGANVVGTHFQAAKIENDFTGGTDKTKAIFLFFQPYCAVRE
jgi:hypothetical protein